MPSASHPTRPDSPQEKPLSVTELATQIKRLLETRVGSVWVSGEVSNLRIPSSGHCYFMLKDESAVLNAVCFRSTLARQAIQPANGRQLELRGSITAYSARSEYQIIVESMREAGLGDLMRRFLELRDKLKAEGLFDASRKRAIPRIPQTIGIVTSSTGAALQDMLNILRRRARGLSVYVAPCAVQGEAAPGEIVAAIRRLERQGRCEVLIVGRGGGSIEDLWSFNDERVVRAIASCGIPVISAVGHETDTTLADFAADLRAPTPSAAAELVCAHHGDMRRHVEQLGTRLRRAMLTQAQGLRSRLERCRTSWGLREPRERLLAIMQRFDDLQETLQLNMRRRLDSTGLRLANSANRLDRANPAARLIQLRQRLTHLTTSLGAVGPLRWQPRINSAEALLEQLVNRLRHAGDAMLERRAWQLESTRGRLAAVNPRAILLRGYSIVTSSRNGRVIRGPGQARVGEIIHVQGADGAWRAVTIDPEPDLFDQLPADA